MGIPWRNARLGDYASYTLAGIATKEARTEAYFTNGQKIIGLVMEAWQDPYRKITDLYVAAPDFLSGESWDIGSDLPANVPHNTIYGIGTQCAGEMLERVRRLPNGTPFGELIDILFH